MPETGTCQTGYICGDRERCRETETCQTVYICGDRERCHETGTCQTVYICGDRERCLRQERVRLFIFVVIEKGAVG